MSDIAIVFFSGYGHTIKQAQAIADGATQAGATVELVQVDGEGNISDSNWQTLNEAKGIIYGAPTYMGGLPWQFKKFTDASSKIWYTRSWQDKLAAGFTNSASLNGDKGATLLSLVTLASQHGQIWVSLGQLPANTKASDRNDPNALGGSVGLLAQSPSDSSPEEGPLAGDLVTAKLFGERFAAQVKRLT